MDITIRRGDTETLEFSITDPSLATALQPNGPPVVLTGAAIRFTAKKLVTDADNAAVITKTVGSGVTITDAAGGKCRVTINPADTTALAPPAGITPDSLKRYKAELAYDLQVTLGGATFTPIAGALIVEMDVSITTP